MHLTNVKFAIDSIRKTYGRRNIRILGESAEEVLNEAMRDAENKWDRFSKCQKIDSSWGYKISSKKPLRFEPSEVLNGAIVDIYCEIWWSSDSSVPRKQDIKIRIWSEHDSFVFRPHLDSKCVAEKLTDPDRLTRGRVISRFHFDRVDHSQGTSGEYHPRFHMQIGGKPENDELCWHPKQFDLPRFPYHPMELLLTCQFVAINFFPDKYSQIRRDPLWERQLLATQKSVMENYYEQCTRSIRDNISLLDQLPTISA